MPVPGPDGAGPDGGRHRHAHRADKLKSNWGKVLDPSGEIPASGFMAIDLDRRNPHDIAFRMERL